MRTIRPLRSLILTLALIPLLAVGASACGMSSATTSSTPLASDGSTPGPLSRSVRVTSPALAVHAEADEASAVIKTLGPKTTFGSQTTLLVLDEQDGYLKVSLPTRPNGSTGWIRTDEVEVRSTTMSITVDRATHHLVLRDGSERVLETTVAIGTAENPTPAGTFYVTDLVKTDNPDGGYGPYALGLSGHSETLTEFAGGDGQLAIHGTNDPSSIGASVSHGCIRVVNDIVMQLAQQVPLGTPVTVS